MLPLTVKMGRWSRHQRDPDAACAVAHMYSSRRTRHADNVTPQNGLRGVVINGLHATDAILTSSITGLPSLLT